MEFTDRARGLIESVDAEAGIPQVLVAIVNAKDSGVARHILDQASVQPQSVRDLLSSKTIFTPPKLATIVQAAESESRALEHHFVGSEHLLLACLKLAPETSYDDLVRKAVPLDYTAARDALCNLLRPADPECGRDKVTEDFRHLRLERQKKALVVFFNSSDVLHVEDISAIGLELVSVAGDAAKAGLPLLVSFKGV